MAGMEPGDVITMVDVFGREVIARRVNQSMETFSVSDLPSGMYIIKINNIAVKSLVKQ